jgi:hypothetical protein
MRPAAAVTSKAKQSEQPSVAPVADTPQKKATRTRARAAARPVPKATKRTGETNVPAPKRTGKVSIPAPAKAGGKPLPLKSLKWVPANAPSKTRAERSLAASPQRPRDIGQKSVTANEEKRAEEGPARAYDARTPKRETRGFYITPMGPPSYGRETYSGGVTKY